jgi:serine-type D-Ala-D-Ala carboxypeptidase (penicillin-binding protein 5/6)
MTSRLLAFLGIAFLAVATVPQAAAARSSITVDFDTGHILDETSPDKKVQIASLTKIATAIVAMDWADTTRNSLAEIVTVPQGILGVSGVNPCGLLPGDQISLRDLIYAAMMQSDNHAAYTLAHNIGSRLPNTQDLAPVDNFTAQMNALARKLGMKRTVFLNPHGLDNTEPPPHSTAEDLARLTRYAYNHAGFTFYVSQPAREISITGPDGAVRGFVLRNTNELLGQDDIDGVKTGRTSLAGDCIVLSADREPLVVQSTGGGQVAVPRRVIVVLLGSNDRFAEGLAKIRQAWNLHAEWVTKGRPVSKGSSI